MLLSSPFFGNSNRLWFRIRSDRSSLIDDDNPPVLVDVYGDPTGTPGPMRPRITGLLPDSGYIEMFDADLNKVQIAYRIYI